MNITISVRRVPSIPEDIDFNIYSACVKVAGFPYCNFTLVAQTDNEALAIAKEHYASLIEVSVESEESTK